MKHDLTDVTFIIPLCIESQDRLENATITLTYLCEHLDTNIIVYEVGDRIKLPFIQGNHPKVTITHIFKQHTGTFHRTKYLNEMLAMVETPVVVNYDIDVLLKPESYVSCVKKIREGVDLLYPYFFGDSQYKVNYQGRVKIKKTGNLNALNNDDMQLDRSAYGHCQFFSTESYRRGGGENERFISYAPEDSERAYRFQKLGFNVQWGSDYIYHLEHTRGVDSSSSNPHFRRNNQLWEYIQGLSVEELRAYYEGNK